MFFEQERKALEYAALGITLASVPGINYLVAFAAAVTLENDLNRIEKALGILVFCSAMLFTPAVMLMPYAIPFLILSFAVDALEWYCFGEPMQIPNFSY